MFLNKKKVFRSLVAMLVCGCCSLPGLAAAEDRALLIGVGSYQIQSANLPGIDLDIDMMKDVAQLLGYKNNQIKVLMDRQATLSNVRKAVDNWLVRGVGPDDRVLIYYSGHGAQIPDESGDETDDKQDEVVTMHDLKPAKINGKNSLKGVLVDDEFNKMLGRIKSRNVLVMIDACHSGSSTKSFALRSALVGESEAIEKFFTYDGMPIESSKSTRGFGVQRIGSQGQRSTDNFVTIGAARDDEKSLASKSGSFFTLGIKKIVNESNQNGTKLTPQLLMEGAARFIKQNVSGNRLFHPQLTGSSQLARQPLGLVAVQNGRGPRWVNVAALVDKLTPLTIRSNKSSYRDGDMLDLSVQVPENGYLNVLTIDAQDRPTVLFPNRYNIDPRVKEGTISIPGQMKFKLPAGSPYGPTMVVAFFSSGKINIFKDGIGERDNKGVMLEYFPEFSEKSMRSLKALRAFSVQGNKKKSNLAMAGKVVVDVSR